MLKTTPATTTSRKSLLRLASGCAWWSVLALVTLGLTLAAPHGILHQPALALGDRVLLVLSELASLGVLVAVATAAGSIAHRGLRIAALSTALLAFGSSWGTFWFTGHFLDREALAFMAGDLRSVLGYAAGLHGILFLAIAAGTVAAAAVVSRILPRLLARLPSPIVLGFTRATVFVVAWCGVGAIGGSLLHARPDEYRACRNFTVGPSARFLSDLLERPDGPEGPVPPVAPAPLITTEDYLRGTHPRPLNVLLIIVDSLRADQLEALGGTRSVMPALETLAQDGTVFTDCLTTATHTDYAMPSIVSSQYPLRSRASHFYPPHLPYPRILLYDLLKAAGWRTGLFSSQDEHWRGMSNYLTTDSLDRYFHAGSDPEKRAARPRSEYPEGTLDDSITVAEAMAWMDEAHGPFFACLNLQNAHAPYHVPADFPRPFGPSSRDFPVAFAWYPREKTAIVKDLYADSLAYIDSNLDRLFRHLHARGEWGRTIVVVTADHGEAFYEHGVAAHGGEITPEVSRVPLLLRVPGEPPGRDGRPAQILDIPPTICHVLGLPPHPAFQGSDLRVPAPSSERSRYTIVQTPFARQYLIDRGGRQVLYDAHLRNFTSPDRDLESRLGSWFNLQVEYYEHPGRFSEGYPPTLP
jgi:arylsulfatase A-like enzyme